MTGTKSSELRKAIPRKGNLPRMVERQVNAFLLWLYELGEDGWNVPYDQFKEDWKAKTEQINRVMKKAETDGVYGTRLFPSSKQKRPGGRPGVGEHVEEQVRQMRRDGKKPRAIAEELGLGQSTVYKIIKRLLSDPDRDFLPPPIPDNPDVTPTARARFRERIKATQRKGREKLARAEAKAAEDDVEKVVFEDTNSA
jgi:hypothetical protein